MTQKHARIVQHAFASLMQGARLNSCYQDGIDFIIDVEGLHVTSSKLFKREQKIYERVTGNYLPLQLRFSNISKLNLSDFFATLENLTLNDSHHTVEDMLSWYQPNMQDIYHIIGMRDPSNARMDFYARDATYKKWDMTQTSMTLERDWSPAPPMPGRLVPRPYSLYKQFGGDPITIHVNGKVRHHMLFIGGIDIQPTRRPHVDAILNLSEESSRWLNGKPLPLCDRAINKGEGSDGMTLAEILQEAEWVIKRLQRNQRLLVHCVAGMNRSTTICCAVLMLLEGLSAEAALERVREHHPWARPDSHHWLNLRWLEVTNKGKTYGHKTRYDQSLGIS